LTDTDKQNSKENTEKQTQYKSEKVNNLKYSKTKLNRQPLAGFTDIK